MSNAQHTPGPWEAKPFRNDHWQVDSVTPGLKRIPVALFAGTEANARLIAAAPDLLEACDIVALLHDAAEALKHSESVIDYFGLLHAAANEHHAAIAKATPAAASTGATNA